MYHSNRMRPRLVEAVTREIGGTCANYSKIKKMLAYIGPAAFKHGGQYRCEALADMKRALVGRN